ncbi:MAG TPA: hypothetical protein VLY82_03300, partial [Nitrososphaerales archaeon]|nr:hypothetical protein [Nitrososphaerales archaeon]
NLRRVYPGAVTKEWVRPHAGPANVYRIQTVDFLPLCLEIKTSGAFSLDPNRIQGKVIGRVAQVLDR